MKHRYRAQFRFLTIVQVICLVASISLLVWTVFVTDHYAVPTVISIVVLLQVISLLRYVEAHVDTLEEFFAAVNYEDFTRRFVEDDVDIELKGAFNRIIQKFQNARAERDFQAGYLETVVRHVPVPFIAVRSDGSLSLVNNPARRLTGLPALQHIDQLAELDPQLPAVMRDIEPGQQQMLQTKLREVPVELRISVSEIRMAGDVERLYSIENLSGELTAREASAWRNLIRVLTHEIMNTLTPVTSLAQTTTTMLDDPEATEDIREAVTTIARRSEGLMKFVARYRELLKVPQPDIGSVSVVDALQGVSTLLGDELEALSFTIDVVPPSLEVQADSQLLDQVLLNLVRNAIDATQGTESPLLELGARLDYGRVVIKVTDNGCGIADESFEQIFVPFFTTKRDGSGIGLSLSRQIMTAHGGDIVVNSDTGGTTVSLVF
ncbi:MAG: histidine kinase [Gammaproteobacteria bacterium]|nr:MAG: histidine kinase [Gammaproteobacteria bacterium]RLA38075.1 MAG: histidine kinase [Gammaproteobacteria bacterium]